MATDFPTSLDTWPNIIDNQTTIMASYINNIQDAVEALEAKVGLKNSVDVTTLSYKVRSFFNRYAPRKIYLYEDSSPTRWSIVSGTGDKMIGVKGGATFTTGGTSAGSWTVTGWDNSTHLHKSWYWSNPYGYTWNSGGSAFAMTSQTHCGESVAGLPIGLTLDHVPCAAVGPYVTFAKVNSGTYAYTNNDTHTHTHAGTWRPVGALGIIVKYDG